MGVRAFAKHLKMGMTMALGSALIITYFFWVALQEPVYVTILGNHYPAPIPDLSLYEQKKAKPEANANLIELYPPSIKELEDYKKELIAARRQHQIDKVEAYLSIYNGGSELAGYGHIIVDQAEKCGGDYRVLIGIAGSESGLGRIMYKKYNPYGYLNGVQYNSLTEALTVLSCRISEQHIAPCGTDLFCLGRRYAGPSDDLNHFVSKVRFFFDQVS